MTKAESTQMKAAEIFEKFCTGLSKVEMKYAILLPAAVGVTIAMAGQFQEVHGQSLLAQQGGLDAVNAYKAALIPVMNFADFIKTGILGQQNSFGGNTQGVGAGVTIAGPVLAMSSVMLAKSFQNIKKYVAEQVEKIRRSPEAQDKDKSQTHDVKSPTVSADQSGMQKMRQIYSHVLDRKAGIAQQKRIDPDFDDDDETSHSPAPGH